MVEIFDLFKIWTSCLSSLPSGVSFWMRSSASARNCSPTTPGPALICDITCRIVICSPPSICSASWVANCVIDEGLFAPLSHKRIRWMGLNPPLAMITGHGASSTTCNTTDLDNKRSMKFLFGLYPTTRRSYSPSSASRVISSTTWPIRTFVLTPGVSCSRSW